MFLGPLTQQYGYKRRQALRLRRGPLTAALVIPQTNVPNPIIEDLGNELLLQGNAWMETAYTLDRSNAWSLQLEMELHGDPDNLTGDMALWSSTSTDLVRYRGATNDLAIVWDNVGYPFLSLDVQLWDGTVGAYHLKLEWDGVASVTATLTGLVDAVVQTQTISTLASNSGQPAQPVLLGASGLGGGIAFWGILRQLQIGEAGGVLHHWPIDDGSNKVARDIVGNVNGTYYGTGTWRVAA